MTSILEVAVLIALPALLEGVLHSAAAGIFVLKEGVCFMSETLFACLFEALQPGQSATMLVYRGNTGLALTMMTQARGDPADLPEEVVKLRTAIASGVHLPESPVELIERQFVDRLRSFIPVQRSGQELLDSEISALTKAKTGVQEARVKRMQETKNASKPQAKRQPTVATSASTRPVSTAEDGLGSASDSQSDVESQSTDDEGDAESSTSVATPPDSGAAVESHTMDMFGGAAA